MPARPPLVPSAPPGTVLAGAQAGWQELDVEAVPLASNDGADVMVRYASRHPKAARMVCRTMGFEVDGSVEDFRAVGNELPFIRFVPCQRERGALPESDSPS